MTTLKRDLHDQIRYYQRRLRLIEAMDEVEAKIERLHHRLRHDGPWVDQVAVSPPPTMTLATGLLLVAFAFLLGLLILLGVLPVWVRAQSVSPPVPASVIFVPVTSEAASFSSPSPMPTTVDHCRPYCQDTNLNWQDLNDVDLTGVHLQRALLVGTDLRHCDLYETNLRGARYSASTRWPPGFNPAAAGAVLITN